MNTTSRCCTVEFRVPFHEVDPLQVLWHGHYLKYFEIARAALFESLGVDLYEFHKRSQHVFPITRSQVKHIRPLRLGERFTCSARLVESQRKLVVDFEVRLLPDNELCARGRTEQVAVKFPELELELVIPEELRAILGNVE